MRQFDTENKADEVQERVVRVVEKISIVQNAFHTVASTLALIALPFFVLFCVGHMLYNGIPLSTIQRVPLVPKEPFNEECIIDEVGCVDNPSLVLGGLGTFYDKTGVQPYIYTTDNVNGKKHVSADELGEYTKDVASHISANDKSIVFFYFEWYPNDVTVYWECAKDTASLFDSEAIVILHSYSSVLYKSAANASEYFDSLFRRSSERIMSITPDWRPYYWIAVGAVVLIVILCLIKSFVMSKPVTVETTDQNSYLPPEGAEVFDGKHIDLGM